MKEPAVAAERRVSWYGVSLDLGDAWQDDTNYQFEADQGAIQRLSFEPSELQPEQVEPRLEEVRQRVDGLYGAKPSMLQPFENTRFSVQGVYVRIKTESLYFLYATLGEQVLGLTATCRAECDEELRRVVRSLRRQGTPLNSSPQPKSKVDLRVYGLKDLMFNSSQVFAIPREYVLVDRVAQASGVPYRVHCSRTPHPPDDSALPAGLPWRPPIDEALAQVPRVEETLVGTPSPVADTAMVRLYRREASATDELGQPVMASASTAVIPIETSVFVTCNLQAVPSTPALLTRFHRLLKSAQLQ